MNDIEKVNVAPDGYFQRIVKPCLLDLRKRMDEVRTLRNDFARLIGVTFMGEDA